MSLAEKATQLYSIHVGTVESISAEYNATSLGQVFAKQVVDFGNFTLSLQQRNELQSNLMTTSRLKIPVSICDEGLHSGAWGATLFPAPPTLGMTFNRSLWLGVAQTLALEARACGVDTLLSPLANLGRDARFGRFSEFYSPDATITAHVAEAMVLGLQGGPRQADGPYSYLPNPNTSAISLAKHFAAYGRPVGGINGGSAIINNRTFLEVYAKPWRVMARAGLRAMMISHQATLDVPMHGNRWAITDLMRNKFGFGDGVALTDENNIIWLKGPHGWGIADNSSDAAAVALTAGVDLDLQGNANANRTVWAYTYLLQALEEGLVTVADIDAAVSRVLASKFASGLMDQPLTPLAGLSKVATPAHIAQSVEASRQGIVLTINKAATLPLNPESFAGKTIAVIGPLAECPNATGTIDPSAVRDWAELAAISRIRDPTPIVCAQRAALIGPYALDSGRLPIPMFPEAFRSAFPGANIVYKPGSGATPENPGESLIPAAAEAASAADHVVLVLGELLETCDEGRDRDDIDLPGAQLDLLDAVRNATTAAGTKLTMLLVNGRPNSFGVRKWGDAAAGLDRVDAMVVLTRPGMGGATAAAELVAGQFNPSGRLAYSWPRGVGQIGSPGVPFQQRSNGQFWSENNFEVVAGRAYPRYVGEVSSQPLFVLGQGLSFTTFNITGAAQVPNPRRSDLSLATAAAGTVLNTPSAASAGEGPPYDPDAVLFTIRVTVANAGARDGQTVVQLYSQDPWSQASRRGSRIVRYWSRLVGFAKVQVPAGQSVAVDVVARADDIALYDDGSEFGHMEREVVGGTYQITAGLDSVDAGATVNVDLVQGRLTGA
jgi:beta-glucosidase